MICLFIYMFMCLCIIIWLNFLPVVSGDGVIRVAAVPSEFDSEALAASDLMALHSSQQLSALAGEHGPDD